MNVVRLFSVVPNSYFVCIIIHICRSDFEALCADLFEGVKAPLVRVLELAQLTKEDIYSVEIVGGSTRIPLVKDIISEVYGKPVSTTLNQDEAVARGCALQCAILSPTFRVRDFSISDTQPFPIQLNWIREENEETGEMILFKAGSGISASKVLTMYRSSPFKITASYHKDSMVPSRQSYIGDFTVQGVLPTTDGKGSKVKVKARSNIHGIFSIINATLYEKLEDPPTPPAPEQQEASSQQEQPMNQDQVKPEEGSGDNPNLTETPSVDTPPQQTDGPQSPEESMQQTESQPQPEEQSQGEQPQGEEPQGQPQQGAENKESQQKMDTEKQPTKAEEKPKKKQVKTSSLMIDGVTTSLVKRDLDSVTEKEGNMQASDKKEADKVDAKNSLEEYVYDTREKLDSQLREFVTEQDKETLSKLLMETEEWLYGDGEDESKSVYQDKLSELKKLGNPIALRCTEYQVRPAVFNQLAQLIVHYEKIVSLYKEGDEQYSHIDAEEMKKVEDDVKKRRQWMDEKSQAQALLPKHADPVVKVSQIQTEQQLMEAVCKPVVSKPKPKAPPPKAEEPSSNESEKDKEGQEEQPSSEQPKEEQPLSEQPKEEQPLSEQPKEEQPKAEGEQGEQIEPLEPMSLDSNQPQNSASEPSQEDMDVD
jgi:molecular chaperone DnaK (HSP70)